MNLRLVVLTPGHNQGKVIPVAASPFLVGRGPRCHLRPASPVFSRVHCALLVRNHRAFVCDQGSAAGTFVNGQPVRGRAELHDHDELRVGPLAFRVRLGAGTPVNRPTPLPPTRHADGPAVEDAVAALLLAMPDQDSGKGAAAAAAVPEPPPPGAASRIKSGATPGSAAEVAKALVAEYRRREQAAALARSG
jgi:predicted component of type VI protein secretion system